MSDDLEHASPLDLLTARPPIVAPFSAINPEPRGCRIVVGLPPAAPPSCHRQIPALPVIDNWGRDVNVLMAPKMCRRGDWLIN